MLQDQLKRFFYRMKITSYDGQHSVELPESILRLISDVTISESSYSDTDQTYPSLNLVLHETAYNTSPGSILDMRFDSEKGFTYVSREEMQSGIYKTRRDNQEQSKPVIFVFGGNNRIEIEWGTLSPRTSRKREFTIQTLSLQGGGTGHGTIHLTALDGLLGAKKTHIHKGKQYVDQSGKHYSLKQVLWLVCKALNYDLEFDGAKVTAFPAYTDKFVPKRIGVGGDTAPADPNTPITQAKGMSMHDFIKDLANKYSSAYEFDTDPKTGKHILKFNYREVRYRSVDRIFTYNDPSGTVLSYKIDSVEGSFNPIAGASSSVDGGENEAFVRVQLVQGEEKVDGKQSKQLDKVAIPSNPEDERRTSESLDRNYVGQSITSPTKDQAALTNEAESLHAKNKYNSAINLVTVGHPSYKPGLIQMNNIGRRYSKKYRMFTVQHKLGNSGYTCTWSGMSHYETDAGVSPDSIKNDEWETVQLVKPASE